LRDKHIHIAEDSALLRLIYKEVGEQLRMNKSRMVFLLWAKFIFYLALVSCFYFFIYLVTNPWLFVLCYSLFGIASVLLAFNFAHDLSHNTVFKSRKLNNLGFIAIYTLVGAHAEAWKYRHIHSHHYAPNVKDYDSDLQISTLIRMIPGSDFKWYHRFQHIYAPLAYTTYSLFWVFIKDFIILFSKEEGQNKNTFYHLSFWMQKLFYFFYLLYLPMQFSNQSWQLVLSAFLIMHLFQSFFLLFTFFMTHHVESTAYPETDEEGFIRESWLMNQVKSSNDFYPFSKAANFIFGGFNNHVAHHLFPHIHHVYYPSLNHILFRILKEHRIKPNVSTYFGGIRSHLRLLRKMGRPLAKIE
jgi:linoleoyl-CoA desaturase